MLVATMAILARNGCVCLSNIERIFIRALFCFALSAIVWRTVIALHELINGDVNAFLALPLTVVLPAAAFTYVGLLRDMASQEGALMQLGVLIQLILIIALPSFALLLALGFPVVFLVVELFETKAPQRLRNAVKSRVLT